MSSYLQGLDDGYKALEKSFKSVAPFWLYGAIDNTSCGFEPSYRFIGAFSTKEDAEAFISYRKKTSLETLFTIDDYSEVYQNEDNSVS